LGRQESEAVVKSVYENVIKTFSYALLLAIVKFLITLISFWFAEFEVIWVFAFVSGFLTIIPILSSWIIWVPATILLISRDGISSGSWVLMVSLNIGGIFIDNALYSMYFKDQKPQIIGMSIILGIYRFLFCSF
jgi:predicted PurR-regulated permease PerM